MPTIPFPSRRRREPPTAIPSVGVLVPYKTTAGWWVFLPAGTMPPAGAVPGAIVHGTPTDVLTTTTTSGLTPRRNGRGLVFLL